MFNSANCIGLDWGPECAEFLVERIKADTTIRNRHVIAFALQMLYDDFDDTWNSKLPEFFDIIKKDEDCENIFYHFHGLYWGGCGGGGIWIRDEKDNLSIEEICRKYSSLMANYISNWGDDDDIENSDPPQFKIVSTTPLKEKKSYMYYIYSEG